MSSYIDDVLVSGEKVIYRGHLSLWSETLLIAGGLLLLVLYGFGLLLWLVAYIRIKSTELAVTNKRVIVKSGFISRSTVEINIGKVESIQVDQSILGRMLDFGTLIISGAGTPQAPINGISHPLKFRQAFLEAQEQAGNLRQP